MTVHAHLESRLNLHNRRYAPRRLLKLGSILCGSDADVVIHDMSVTGMLIETPGDLFVGERLLIEIPERGPTPATVMWNEETKYGCAFEEALPVSALSAAILRDPVDPSRSAFADDSEADQLIDPDRLSKRARLAIILALAVASWAIIALGIAAVLG